MALSQTDPSWGTYNYASLWVAMSVCIPTYMLTSGLIAESMSWIQAILTILLGNLIVLIPMLLNAHAAPNTASPSPSLCALPSVSVAPTFPPSFALSSLAAGLAFRPGSVVRPFIPCSAFSGPPPRTSTARPGSVSFFSGASIVQPLGSGSPPRKYSLAGLAAQSPGVFPGLRRQTSCASCSTTI